MLGAVPFTGNDNDEREENLRNTLSQNLRPTRLFHIRQGTGMRLSLLSDWM